MHLKQTEAEQQCRSSAADPTAQPPGLMDCCRILARRSGREDLAAQLDGFTESADPAGRKAAVEHVIQTARRAGMQTVIQRPDPNQLVALSSHLPAVVELRNGTYALLMGLGTSIAGIPATCTLAFPQSERPPNEEQVSTQRFLQMWSGGLLSFERLNTALVCFSIVAREHGIELTTDRLVHEYGLDKEEIPTATLLRMAKELGSRPGFFVWIGRGCCN